jgi:hypothetical protein
LPMKSFTTVEQVRGYTMIRAAQDSRPGPPPWRSPGRPPRLAELLRLALEGDRPRAEPCHLVAERSRPLPHGRRAWHRRRGVLIEQAVALKDGGGQLPCERIGIWHHQRARGVVDDGAGPLRSSGHGVRHHD